MLQPLFFSVIVEQAKYTSARDNRLLRGKRPLKGGENIDQLHFDTRQSMLYKKLLTRTFFFMNSDEVRGNCVYFLDWGTDY